MKAIQIARFGLVLFACLGMLLPVQLFASDSKPRAGQPKVSRVLVDISLQAGRLTGRVTDADGIPVAETLVVAVQNRKAVSRAMTDKDGTFSLSGIRGGLCHVVAGNMVQVCRCWTREAAPPAAKPHLLIASDTAVVRGQRPLSERVFAKPVLLGLVLAAAIAIPIAVHNSKRDSRSGS
ncbi:MAG: carboxypeptidase-like regulatory domain-containing protein [Planctomycetota bacterium]